MSHPLWSEIEVGQCMPQLEVGPVTRTDFVRYQGASGDMNPVHHDEPFATAAGFPAPLGVGMFPAGVMAAWAADWLGPDRIRRTRIRWRRPVFPDHRLSVTGEIVRKFEEGEEQRVELAMTCTNQNGEVALQVWTTFVVGA